MVKKILINTIWVGIVPRLSTLLTILLLPFSTPFLTAEDYGIVGIVTSYYSFFYAIYTLGLNAHLNNSFFEYGNKFSLVWSRIYFLLILSGVVCSLIISVILFDLLKDGPILKSTITVILVSSQFLFGSNLILANHLFPLRNRFREMVIPILISNVFGIICSFILVKYFRLGYIGLLSNASISTFISFLLFIKPLWYEEKIRPVIDMKLKRLKELFRISLPVIPHTFGFMLMASSDRLVMQYYNVPIQDIGMYTNGYTIGDYVNILTAAMIITLTPTIHKLYLKSSYFKVRQLYFFSQIIAGFIVFISSIWMKEIYFVLIKNEELQKSSYIANMIAFSSILSPFYYLLSTITFADKKTKNILWLVLAPGILNLLLNFIFIPIYGFQSALYTTLISYWSILLVSVFIPYYRNAYFLFFKSYNVLLIVFSIILLLLFISQFLLVVNTVIKIVITILLIIAIISYLLFSNKHLKFDFSN